MTSSWKQRALSLAILALCLIAPRFAPVKAQDGQAGPLDGEVKVHVLQNGETLASVAALYGVTVEQIEQTNGIFDPSELQIGTRLIIPAARSGGTGLAWGVGEIQLGFSDSLAAIALEHEIALEALGQANRIANPAAVYVGQTISAPAGLEGARSGWKAQRLAPDESLLALAVRANLPVSALAIGNRLRHESLLAPGSLILAPEIEGEHAVLLEPWVSLTLHPMPLTRGHSGALQIALSTPGELQGTLGDQALGFAQYGETAAAVFGIERWTKPGLTLIQIQHVDGSGKTTIWERRVLVDRGEYQSEDIRLSSEVATALSDTQMIAEENAYIASVMSGFTPERHWIGLFQMPTAGVLTSTFGTVRLYNDNAGVNNYHLGNDFAAKVGTPIYAPADGVVADTGELTIRGLVTIIDHGWGVYTGYWHQSSILVRPGDKVVAGQQIGTIGNTGLSTAAHLHWEMWVGGAPVDSLQWARESFP